MDSLILCKFLRGVFADFYSEAAEMLRLVTGWDVTAQELRTTAGRIVTARKRFNIRAGWTAEEDTLPPRLLDRALADDPQAHRYARGTPPRPSPLTTRLAAGRRPALFRRTSSHPSAWRTCRPQVFWIGSRRDTHTACRERPPWRSESGAAIFHLDRPLTAARHRGRALQKSNDSNDRDDPRDGGVDGRFRRVRAVAGVGAASAG